MISHGSPDGSWVTLVDEAMAQAAWPEGVPIASSFLDCVPGRTIQDGIDELEAQGVDAIGVIPLFISGGSTHVDEIAYALGVTSAPLADTKLPPFRLRAQVRYGRPLDGAALFAAACGGDGPGGDGPAGEPEAGTVLLHMVEDRLRGLGAGAGDAALLVAHGSRHEPFAGPGHPSLRPPAPQL
ncbi:sirohydrochlorin chelatase, partial [Paenibacillus thiaminolyticus]|uniref:sirohydrochlorin chelatase n=1 Tax=Paenibacillus thiaminolyticus TaxID=49283 RepID=UPI002E12787E